MDQHTRNGRGRRAALRCPAARSAALSAAMAATCPSVALAQACDPTEIFAPQVAYDTGNRPYAVAIGDLDGDGDADLAVANDQQSTVSVLLNNGDGTFAAEAPYNAGGSPVCVALGDLDGDGDADLAVANFIGDTVGVLLNNGDGAFATPWVTPRAHFYSRW